MRIFAILCLMAFAPLPLMADEAKHVKKVETYLSGLKTIVADFVQAAPDGTTASGQFYLKRPKKMRWQYNPPTPIVMVTRGGFLTYYDYELDQVSDIPLQGSLLGILTKEKIAFGAAEIAVAQVQHSENSLRISLQEREAPDDGTLTLEFSENPMQLVAIELLDKQREHTRIMLQNARFNEPLEDDVFAFKDPRVGKKKRSRR